MTSANLYKGIQGYFKQEYAGRYLGILLAETCAVDELPFVKFFNNTWGISAKSITLDKEHRFRGKKGVRLADLAVIADGELVGLVELKYRDQLMPKTETKPAQLEDYLFWCQAQQKHLLVMHRLPLLPEEIATLTSSAKLGLPRLCRCHYLSLATYLEQSHSHASHLLYDYFREEGLVMTDIDEDMLYRFLHRLLKPLGGAGPVTMTNAMTEGTLQFRSLVHNMTLVAAELTPKVRRPNSSVKQHGATIDITVYPEINVKKLSSALARAKEDGDEAVLIESGMRTKGSVTVYAQNALGIANDFGYVEYGLDVSVSAGASHDLKVDLYARLKSKAFGFQDPRLKRVAFSVVAKSKNKGKLEEKLLRLIGQAASEYLSDSASLLRTNGERRRATKYFQHLKAFAP